MAKLSLEGLTLHVADLERSLAFYTRLPGVAVEFHKPGLFAMLRIGKGRIGLLQRRRGPVPRRAGDRRPRRVLPGPAPGGDRAQGAARQASLGRARLPGGQPGWLRAGIRRSGRRVRSAAGRID